MLIAQSQPRIHKNRKVRPHPASGTWTTCIGKTLNKDKTKLRPKDWYFQGMSQAEANKRVSRLERDWAFLVKNWETMYAPTLRIIGSPFADIPHWQPMRELPEPDPKQLADFHKQPPTTQEIAEVYEDITLAGVQTLFELQLEVAVHDAWTDLK